MKKFLGMMLVLAMAVMFVVPAFAADTSDNNSAKSWFQQMFDFHKAQVDQAVKDGQLTEEQGKAYKEQFNQMYQFHQENGFVCPMGGPGYGMGYGRNMMNGYSY
ncbi:DUF2680 domain-containing protein [Desulforamulus ruminis]|uniref:DUF2680 domain-containing protein n=1 Tax=Desulforamulus ruminis (strain ATCC 23193 / DSM 2154 / NCIMB 8452 / DL) TaxID=696281 RepID=F6DRW7_DESRL|nr:DUF2680 domain-containing protein [Desulforamulus ruminis]AEG60991.1 hypothetical protein Desru_2773 [Desulforamulus ruminis DSM 2154]